MAFSPSISAVIRRHKKKSVAGIVGAMLVGLLFGLYPAMKASELSPMEALRYE